MITRHTADPASYPQSYLLAPDSCILNPDLGTLNPEFCILTWESSPLDPDLGILNPGLMNPEPEPDLGFLILNLTLES